MEIICVLILFVAAIFFAQGINTIFRFGVVQNKFVSIEGLRGILAFSVFIHHFFIWRIYMQTGVWTPPASHFLNHLGRSAVAFFFIITGFLFFDKLLGNKKIDWVIFYKRRFLRLFPAYAIIVAVMILVILYISSFQLKEPFPNFLQNAFHWLAFNYFDSRNVNGFTDTKIVTAGVVWSLRYEIFFYAFLSLMGLLFNKKAGWFTLIISTFFVVLFFVVGEDVSYNWLLYFVGGFIAAFLIKKYALNDRIKTFLQSHFATLLMLLVLATNVYLYHGTGKIISVLFCTLAFIPIAFGNSIFGLLNLKPIQVMGQISYSIYLCHGIVLFAFSKIIVGEKYLSALSLHEYLLAGIACAFFVLFFSFVLHKWIEKPFMAKAKIGQR